MQYRTGRAPGSQVNVGANLHSGNLFQLSFLYQPFQPTHYSTCSSPLFCHSFQSPFLPLSAPTPIPTHVPAPILTGALGIRHQFSVLSLGLTAGRGTGRKMDIEKERKRDKGMNWEVERKKNKKRGKGEGVEERNGERQGEGELRRHT